MGVIRLNNIQLNAFHGCMKQELNTGGRFQVDIAITTSFDTAVQSDAINDAISYVDIYEIVKSEMAVPSNLIEHVAKRILDAIANKFNDLDKIWVKVTKLEAPITNFNGSVSVELEETIV
jgi:dihydroneopterin aldolase